MTGIMSRIKQHLESLDLLPEILPETPLCPEGYGFQLAPGIHSELFVLPQEKHLQTQMITAIDCPTHEELHIFGAILSPHAVPLSFDSLQGQVALRLTMITEEKDALPVLSEGIVMMRHMAGIFFTAALSLCEGKKSLTEAIAYTFDLLGRAGSTSCRGL